MVERKRSFAALGRLLFIGPLSGAREKLLEDLAALGMHVESVPALDAAGARLSQCDFVLAALSSESQIARLKSVREAGKTMGLVLRPEDKALAPAGLKAGARAVLVDEVHPDEVVQLVHSLTEEGILRREVRWLRTEFRESGPKGGVPGSSAAAERFNRAIKRAGKRYRVVLARGEKGSNFLQLARTAHHQFPGLRHPLLHWEASQRPAAALRKSSSDST